MTATEGRGIISATKDLSAIIDLAGGVSRQGNCHIAAPNGNLIHPRTMLPRLRVSLLASVVLVTNNPRHGAGLLKHLPVMRDLDGL